MKKLFILVMLFCSMFIYAEEVEFFGSEVPVKYYDVLVLYCTEFNVPIIYAARLIQWESGWNFQATKKNENGTIDRGLMMHNSASLEDFAFRYNNNVKYDPFNWKDSLRIGINHLSILRKNTGSWFGAICAYNMGLTAYNKWLETKRPLPDATLKIVQFVFG
jgi:soluble lytic murein transglycosylase-like protein